jgi:DNA-binding MarR family transcriptional regulator
MATRASDNGQETACKEALRLLSPDKQAAWMGFLRAHSLVTKALDAELVANFGISLSAFQALLRVSASADGYLKMSELAEQAMLSQSRVSRLVTELERRGVLERRSCPSDTRVVYAAITDEGRALVERVQELHAEGIERRFFSDLSADQVRQLAAVWPLVIEATAGATR